MSRIKTFKRLSAVIPIVDRSSCGNLTVAETLSGEATLPELISAIEQIEMTSKSYVSKQTKSNNQYGPDGKIRKIKYHDCSNRTRLKKYV